MPPPTHPRCNDLPFETGILGRPVARLQLDQKREFLDLKPVVSSYRSDWLQQGIHLVSCRLPQHWAKSRAILEAAGFYRVETLVSLNRPNAHAPRPAVDVVMANDDDRAPCMEIGRSAFTFDRFHSDPAIDDALASNLKATWVENSFLGRADAILVLRENGIAQGFVLCLRSGDESVIDLIAIAPGKEGRGYGRALVYGALNHYADRVEKMNVGTQDNNTASIGLYHGTGFSEVQRFTTYHWINPEMAA
jgi:ribosomal protein S18 acetylase RimI-like enzyme